jgi:RNA polymerase sigma-70 factor (ECF subfamily)
VTQTATAFASENRVPEPELIARVLRGDQVAARELYDAHASRVYRLAFRLTGDAELAREYTQDVFVRAFANLPRFRGDSALGTWLYRITLSVVSDAVRKVKRLREREIPIDELQLVGDDHSNGSDPVLRERLHHAIDALPEVYRIPVILHDIEGYTHPEIAEIVGVAEGTCRSRLSMARARLRAALGDLNEELT